MSDAEAALVGGLYCAVANPLCILLGVQRAYTIELVLKIRAIGTRFGGFP
jgi:hypothetical protein